MSNYVSSIIETANNGLLIDVECRITNGLPAIIIVGYANKSTEEAKERLRGAFSSSNLTLPIKRITLNLAPGDIPKDGTSFDLAMATAILLASRQSLAKQLQDSIIIGELSLDGGVRPVRGIIGKLLAARSLGLKRCFIPAGNLTQAQLVPGLQLYGISRLSELYEHLTGLDLITPTTSGKATPNPKKRASHTDLRLIAGQAKGKRAIEIAAAGGHNLLLTGPPGTGKTMLGKALPGLLPPLSAEEVLEVTHLHSLAGSRFDQIIYDRPFRNPHHSASLSALIGGGNHPRPGEISLSHHGILFLDELPEFQRSAVEALRQPLEDAAINLARGKHSVTFPANFLLVATANPCPCGYFGSFRCQCPAHLILAYQRRLSGPIVDRIDLVAEADPTEHQKILAADPASETSAIVRKRVLQARRLQHRRQKQLNSRLDNTAIKRHAQMSQEAELALNHGAKRAELSGRAYIKAIKVARTIADLRASPQIELPDMLESLQFRKQE